MFSYVQRYIIIIFFLLHFSSLYIRRIIFYLKFTFKLFWTYVTMCTCFSVFSFSHFPIFPLHYYKFALFHCCVACLFKISTSINSFAIPNYEVYMLRDLPSLIQSGILDTRAGRYEIGYWVQLDSYINPICQTAK